MKVLIAGAGRLGTQIAQVLSAARNDVTLVEYDDDRVAELGGLREVRVVAGDACEPGVLEHAGALACDLVIAATGRDEDNPSTPIFEVMAAATACSQSFSPSACITPPTFCAPV
ncbi:NAD-binding protein, partial [Streptomyces sp. SAS_269]|uniref:NAD-binding protein n=1 Tax=Streptomyces sp. SAS_269 TaxID=3412749 RepID=UPI00403CF4C2